MTHAVQNIFDFHQGAVILYSNYPGRDGKLIDMYGHVEEFSINDHNEVMLRVKWADGTRADVHPARVHLRNWRA